MKLTPTKILGFVFLILFSWCCQPPLFAKAARANPDKDWISVFTRPPLKVLNSADFPPPNLLPLPAVYHDGMTNQTIRQIAHVTAQITNQSQIRLRFYS